MRSEAWQDEGDETRRIVAGLEKLQTLYAELIRAYVPPNPQFEFERILSAVPNRRELVFLLGLMNEGENEAALLCALIGEALAADQGAATEHILAEAAYYLRTSIDSAWQLEEAPASTSASITYLLAILTRRLERLQASPARFLLEDVPGSKLLLQTLQRDSHAVDGLASVDDDDAARHESTRLGG